MEESSSSSLTSPHNSAAAAKKKEERGKKKSGRLPLMMYLNMEDNFLLPDCPNASNPFHKCAPYCFNRASQATKEILGGYPLVVIRKERKEDVQMKETSHINPMCKYASNPFHTCTEHCMQNNSRGRDFEDKKPCKEDAVKRQPKEATKAVGMVGVEQECKYASNPFHECAGYCLGSTIEKNRTEETTTSTEIEVSNPKKTENLHAHSSNPSHEHEISPASSSENYQAGKGKHKDAMTPMDLHVNPECINASNPFHVCAEYCRQKVHDKDAVHGGLLDIKSSEKKMSLSNAMKLLKLKAGNASNQQSNTVTYAPIITEKDHSDGGTWKKVGKMDRWNVHPDCVYASNSYHVCVDECFDLIRDKYRHNQEHSTKGSTLAKKLKEAASIDASVQSYDCSFSCFGKSSRSNHAQEDVEERKDDAKIQNGCSQSKTSDTGYPKFESYYSSPENGEAEGDDGENTSESEDDGDSRMPSDKVSISVDLSNSSDRSIVHCLQGPSTNEEEIQT